MPQPIEPGHARAPSAPTVEQRLAAWRERLLERILTVLVVLGSVTSAVSAGFMYLNREWIAAGVMAVCYLLAVGAWRGRSLGFQARAGAVLLIGWGLGVYLTVAWGPIGAGNSFFFAVTVLAAILLDRRASYRILGFVALTQVLLAIGIAAVAFPWAQVPSDLPHLGTFVSRALSMLFLAGGTSVGVSALAEGLAQEVSARRDAERERLELAAAVEQSGDLVLLVDRDGRIRYANAAMRRLVGPERASFVEETALEWFERMEVLEGEPARMPDIWARVFEGERWAGTLRLRDPRPPVPAGMVVAGTLSPMRDDGGSIQAVLGVFRDVGRERELEAQLRQSSKLQAVGTLVSGIAHDFNNLLQPILLNAGSLEEALDDEGRDSAPARRFIVDIRHAAERGASLVRRILTFTREAELEREPVELGAMVEEAAALVRASIPAGIELEVGAEPGLVVHADRNELQQVLLNLTTNAAHAMPDGGRLSVRVARRRAEEDPAGRQVFEEGAVVAEIAVADTGTGMDASTMERAFEPFFTTKAPGTGTGLGLATAHGTVAALGGIILAESTPGVGTTMRVQLPMMAPAAPEASIDAASEAGPTSDVRHVLVVDDEPLVLRATTRMLENRGLRVTPCGDPTEALDRIAGAEPAIDCVVTDFSMPGLNGLGLAARIRESHPRMPIVLVTGFLENQNAQRAAGAGVTRVLNKPFRSAQLLEAIAQACTEVSGGGGTHREGAPE